MSRIAPSAAFSLLLVFSSAIADDAASAPSASALSKQLFSIAQFERSYQAGVASSRKNVMKKFDILAESESCHATSVVGKNYRAALDALIDSAIGKKKFSSAIEQQLATLNLAQRHAAMAVLSSPRAFDNAPEGFSAWVAWLGTQDSNTWHDVAPGYTVAEKVAGLLAIKRGIAALTREGNEVIRAQGYKIYGQYKQQMIDALDRCIADEENRLKN